jgi:hypothetical protein
MYINKPHNNTAKLEDLTCGSVFATSGGLYYMKIYDPMCNNNAVNLCDGDVCYFDEATIVYIVDYEFTIK